MQGWVGGGLTDVRGSQPPRLDASAASECTHDARALVSGMMGLVALLHEVVGVAV